MGRKSKTPHLLRWMQQIHEDECIHTRTFFTSSEIFLMFQEYYVKCTLQNDITHNGIISNINQIIKEGIFPFLKRLEKKTRYKKESLYIFLDNNDDLNMDLKDINVRKRRFATPQSVISPSKKATPQATPQVSPQASPQAISQDIPQATPQVVPTPQVIPQATSHLIPSAVFHPIPYYIQPIIPQAPTPSPPSPPVPPVDYFNEILKASTLSAKLESFIESTKDLDFKSTPRRNVFHPWLPDITINRKVKAYNDNFRKYLIMKASEIGYKELTFKNQLKVGEALL